MGYDVGVQAGNSNTKEEEAGRLLQISGQPGLHSEC